MKSKLSPPRPTDPTYRRVCRGLLLSARARAAGPVPTLDEEIAELAEALAMPWATREPAPRSRLTVRRPALAAMTRRAVPEPPFDLPDEEPIAAPAPPAVRAPDPAEQAEAEERGQPMPALPGIPRTFRELRRTSDAALDAAIAALPDEVRLHPLPDPPAALAHPKATPYPVGTAIDYRTGPRAPWRPGAVVADTGEGRLTIQAPGGKLHTLPRRRVLPRADRERQARVLTQILDGPIAVRRAEDVRIVRTTGELVPVPKPAEPWRSEAYRAYVRTWPCASCGREHEVQAHHHGPPGSRGVGEKCSDAFCIPLCAVCHEHWHATRTLRGRPGLDAIGIRLLVAETQRDLLIDYFVSGLPSEEPCGEST